VSDGPDLAGLLETLGRHHVAHVVAGSVGALAHGAPDVEPADLDIVPATDAPNLLRLDAALAELDAVAATETGEWQTDEAGEYRWVEDGVPRPVRPREPDDPDSFDHSFATRHGRLDVVPRIAGSYEALRLRAERRTIAGREAWVAHPIDLLAGLTSPRRTRDGPRIRYLRQAAAAPSRAAGVGFIGFRTDRFDEMVRFFRDRIGLAVIREAAGATWFRLGTDAELHVYAETDPDHRFFTTGPVVGLRVDDVEVTRAALEADGLEMLTEVERAGDLAWCHFRAPDGTVLEIIATRA
jgi:catechol 2,3-dioxygenase-like lactoylglutathione lyase family enzyme